MEPSHEEAILHDTELVERIFELRMTIAETESVSELEEIQEALDRDYKEEIGKLSRTFEAVP